MTLEELDLYKSAALPHYQTLAKLPSSTLAKRRGLIERAARKANLKEKYIDLPEHAPLREKAKGMPSTIRANRMDMLQNRIHHARETYQAASESNRNTNRARQAFQNEKAKPPFQKSSEYNMNLTDLGFHKCAAYTPKQLQAVADHTLERLGNSYWKGSKNIDRAYQSGHGRLGQLSKSDPSKFNEIANKADSAWFDVTSEQARRARNTRAKLKPVEQLNEDYQARLQQMAARRK